MEQTFESLYRQIGQLVAEMPNLEGPEALSKNDLRWLGRTSVILNEVLDAYARATFNVASQGLNVGNSLRGHNAHAIATLLYQALATIEAKIPAQVQGAFIPVGAGFDAVQALAKVLREAKDDVLIVDPYMDARILTDFAPLIGEKVSIRLLFDAHRTKVGAVVPVAQRWINQYGGTRPLKIRQTSPRALHDRLIFIDGKTVFSLTQSLKDFASRSPASVLRVDNETASMKLVAYDDMWRKSTCAISTDSDF